MGTPGGRVNPIALNQPVICQVSGAPNGDPFPLAWYQSGSQFCQKLLYLFRITDLAGSYVGFQLATTQGSLSSEADVLVITYLSVTLCQVAIF